LNKTVYILRTIIGGELHGKILILSVSDSEDHILEKILKAVEGSADIEDRTLPSEKIELADFTSRKDGLSERAGNSAQPPRI